jgi:4-aminobutyrate aminotransferase-like enzyme
VHSKSAATGRPICARRSSVMRSLGDIRGRGLLQGIELVRDRSSKEPATEIAADIYRHCLANGLMFSVRGKFKNVLRFVPPFTTTNAQLDQATEILEAGMHKAIA